MSSSKRGMRAVAAVLFLLFVLFSAVACAPVDTEPTGTIGVSNLATTTMGGLELHTESGWRQKVQDIGPRERVTIQLGWDSPPGEGSVWLLDSKGGFDYLLVAYFEEPIAGSADVRIKEVLGDGRMVLKVRDQTGLNEPGPYEPVIPEPVTEAGGEPE